MIRRWVGYLALLLAALVFHIYYYGWLSWYLLILLLAVPLLSLLLSLPAMLGQRVRWNWQHDARCSRGKSASLRLGSSDSRLPVARCQLRLRITHLGTGRIEEQSFWLSETDTLELDTSHCGVLRCELTRGWAYDYLGLFRLPRKLPTARELTILPIPTAPEPRPSLAGTSYKRWRPKAGGGFSEQHELREYRPGDPMRSVHWKLMAKMDELIVREAMVPLRNLVVLSFDLREKGLDETLDQLCWTTDWLLQQDIPHELRWLDPATGKLRRAPITQPGEFDLLLEQLLRTKLDDKRPSLRFRTFPKADWQMFVG